MIRVLLFGAAGRMGRDVIAELSRQTDMRLVAGVERADHPLIGGTIEGLPLLADGGDLPPADVWIDFSRAEAVADHAERAASTATPLIIAATGYSDVAAQIIEWSSRNCAVLAAPNLSVGIAVVDRLAQTAAQLLGSDFDSGIFELHHTAKKDAPSGTAKRLAQGIASQGRVPTLVSLRAGKAVGEHRIHFVGSNEEITITHRAWNRQAFAAGVPRAVRFIYGREAGLYSMRDMLEEGGS